MATTNFSAGTTIASTWLNDVDTVVYDILGIGTTLKVGDSGMYGYTDNSIVRIYGDLGLPVAGGDGYTIRPMIRAISQSKGDNTTFVGSCTAYFEARDRSDVTAANKGVLYALSLSVVPSVARNNVPYDDVAGLTIINSTGTVGAKATDAMYISHNSFAFTGQSEWYSAFTADCNADVGIALNGRLASYGIDLQNATLVSGIAFNMPNGGIVSARNSADTQDRTLLKMTTGDVIEIGSAATARVDVKLPMIATNTLQVTGALQCNGGWFGTTAPVSVSASTYTVITTDNYLTVNYGGTCTLTLPAAGSFTGRILKVRTVTANTVVSASSNVVALTGGAAGTAILSATAGKWAELVSDGAVWQIMSGN